MTGSSVIPLSLEAVEAAVRGEGVAFRSVARLEPAGGPGDKVFPPTYQGGQYHTESRRVGDEVIETVVLDSVQSQANRMELALKAAYERGEIELPLVVSDFGPSLPHIGRITALDAPHRIADAIFRDSELDGKPFRQSDPGKRFESAAPVNATPLFGLCPTALVFGVWDSTGPKGGLGSKFARTLVSEMVGFAASAGVRTGSRIDPLPVSAQVRVFEAARAAGGGWTVDPVEAATDAKGEPVPYKGKDGKGKGKPSELNLGNVTPDFARVSAEQARAVPGLRQGDPLPGGVTISYATQTVVLSLPALRRLRFPVGGHEESHTSSAARTVLAALALTAVAYQRREGFDLRSRCLLVPSAPAAFELVPADGGTPTPFSLDADGARAMLAEAVDRARKAGLPWGGEVKLKPSERLVKLVEQSEAVLARAFAEDLNAGV